MLTKNSPIEIPEHDPFFNDKLGRRETGVFLTKLISTVNEPFVLALDAGWGKGKTTFINMWSKHLKKEEYTTLYYNAWENDFVEDPLISFIGEMGKLIDGLSGAKRTKAKKLLDKTKNVGGELIKQAIPIVVKVATYGALDIEKYKEDALANLVSQFAKEKIENYEKEKDAIKGFRNELEKLIKHVQSDSNKPVIFFIDELDRCRPTFAIALLERLKHLFNVKGVVFVLGIDKEQLSHSVKTLYGSDMEADGYLRRFIDLSYELPNGTLKEYIRMLIEKFGLRQIFSERQHIEYKEEIDDAIIMVLTILSKQISLSLRDIEQVFTQLNIIYRTSGNRIDLLPEFLIALIVIKDKNRKLYISFLNQKKPVNEIMDYLNIKDTDNDSSRYKVQLDTFLKNAFSTREQVLDAYNSFKQSETEEDWIINATLRRMTIRFIDYPILDYLIRKINLSESFK